MSTEKGKGLSGLLCGLSTALMIISNLLAPVGMVIWLDAATQRQQDTDVIDAMIVMVICCTCGMIGSIILAVIAKIKNRQSKWATVCIVISGILLATEILSAFIFIWIASQYHYYA
ncbi:MAG: hypothetical protein K6E72_01365 [Saccharofermentans sp.]|jgi:hypothetical protein|nr:hypothetical protein [Clostridiales bacterium]MCR5383277.1 hypothetical protein [Saccharofermentans sp.]